LQGGRLLVVGAKPERSGQALSTEYFSPVLALMELPGRGAAFFQAAVDAANNDLVGTLGST
jgi:aldehyde dehydrogenase (NAD(P)+)